MRLKDRISIVTGGGSGIGRATALRLASEGASVLVADIDGDSAAQTVASIESGGGRAASVVADVSDPRHRREGSGLTAAFLQWHLERGIRSLRMVER